MLTSPSVLSSLRLGRGELPQPTYACPRCLVRAQRNPNTAQRSSRSFGQAPTKHTDTRRDPKDGPTTTYELSQGGKGASKMKQKVEVSDTVKDYILAAEQFTKTIRGTRPLTVREYLTSWQAKQKSVMNADPLENDLPVTPLVSDNASFGVGRTSDPRPEQYASIHDEDVCADVEFAFLNRGDLVELRSQDDISSTLAIYVRSINRQQQFYTNRGAWKVALGHQIAYVQRDFAPLAEVSQVLPFLPAEEIDLSAVESKLSQGAVPRPVGAPLVERMYEYEAEADKTYRDNIEALDLMYDRLASEREEIRMTLEDIALRVLHKNLDDITPPMLYAVHRAIKGSPFYISAPNHFQTKTVHRFRPKDEARKAEQTLQWVRLYQEIAAIQASERPDGRKSRITRDLGPFNDFLVKARRIVAQSRKMRAPTTLSNIGPNPRHDVTKGDNGDNDQLLVEAVETETFTETDQVIIDFLRLWTTGSITEGTVLGMVGSLILRATGLYRGIGLNSGTGNMFLQELGVFSPWENIELLREEYDLPGHGVSKLADDLFAEAEKSCSPQAIGRMQDSMQAFRKDWGDLPVFCIDDSSALEIDDGFSLEPIESNNNEYWIHVHVANPSAFFTPGHALGEYATFAASTFYSPEGAYPMLPWELASELFSLKSGRPVLTFSSRVTLDGDVLDVKVQHGIIRNVITAEPSTVRQALGFGHHDKAPMVISVGFNRTFKSEREGMRSTLTAEQSAILGKLRDLGDARYRRLKQNGAFELAYPPGSSVSVCTGAPMERSITHYSSSSHYTGDPYIEIRAQPWDFLSQPTEHSASKDLVARMMLLAGESAARWCRERALPVIYAGTVFHPEFEHLTQERIDSGEALPFNDMGMPRSTMSSSPVPHEALGMEAYVKVTSPLRRFSDLLAHWQIEAVIKKEAEMGRPLITSDDQSFLPFPDDKVSKLIPDVQLREYQLKDAQRRTLKHWHTQLLFRAFYFREAALPESFQCMIAARAGFRVMDMVVSFVGVMMPFGIQASIVVGTDCPDLAVGDVIEAKIVLVEAHRKIVAVRAIRRIRKAAKVGSVTI